MIMIPIPDAPGVRAVSRKLAKMDRDMAERQVTLVMEAYQSLNASKSALSNVAAGQNAGAWTADGKSVELASMLTARYNATLAWRDALEAKLDRAREILRQAIDSTTEFDEETQRGYLAILDNVNGTGTDGKPAV